jgi:hypothetical protein
MLAPQKLMLRPLCLTDVDIVVFPVLPRKNGRVSEERELACVPRQLDP